MDPDVHISDNPIVRKLAIPPNCPPEMLALMRSCWSNNPDHRKTFAEVLDLLEEQMAALEGNAFSLTLCDAAERGKLDLGMRSLLLLYASIVFRVVHSNNLKKYLPLLWSRLW
jgi:hypothetical protein